MLNRLVIDRDMTRVPTKIAKLDFRENFRLFLKKISRFSNNFRENFRENRVNIFAKIDQHLNLLTSSFQQLTNLVKVMYLIKCNKRFHWSLLSKVIMLTSRKYRGYRRTVDTEDTGGQWIQGNSRYSGYWPRGERIQTGSGYRQTVEKVDAGGKWILRIKANMDTGKQ